MTHITRQESHKIISKGKLSTDGDKGHPEQLKISGKEPAKDSNTTLYDSVVSAMDAYFSHLDGEHSTGIYHMVMAQVESALLASVMKHVSNNQTKASKCLGISRGTLLKKLTLYKIISSRKRGTSR